MSPRRTVQALFVLMLMAFAFALVALPIARADDEETQAFDRDNLKSLMMGYVTGLADQQRSPTSTGAHFWIALYTGDATTEDLFFDVSDADLLVSPMDFAIDFDTIYDVIESAAEQRDPSAATIDDPDLAEWPLCSYAGPREGVMRAQSTLSGKIIGATGSRFDMGLFVDGFNILYGNIKTEWIAYDSLGANWAVGGDDHTQPPWDAEQLQWVENIGPYTPTGSDPVEPDVDKPPLTEEQVRDLIDQLGAPSLKQRDDAMRELIDAGDIAVDHLEVAARRGDLEIAWRARQALRYAQWGVPSDQIGPGLLGEMVDRYLGATLQFKAQILTGIRNQFPAKVSVNFFRKVCMLEDTQLLRRQAFELLRGSDAMDTAGLAALAREIIESDPTALWAYHVLATHYKEQGEREKALETLQAILERDPNDSTANVMIAKLLIETEQPFRAVPYLQRARTTAAAGDQRRDVTRTLAEVYRQLGREDLAMALLEELLATAPSLEDFRTVIRYHFSTRNLDAAEAVATRALEAFPENLTLRAELIVFWENEFAYDRLEPFYQFVIDQLDPRYDSRAWHTAYLDLAHAQWLTGRPDDAVKSLQTLIDSRNGQIGDYLFARKLCHAWGLTEAQDEFLAKAGLESWGNDLTFQLALAREAYEWRQPERLATQVDAVAQKLGDPKFAMLQVLAEYCELLAHVGESARVEEVLSGVARRQALTEREITDFLTNSPLAAAPGAAIADVLLRFVDAAMQRPDLKQSAALHLSRAQILVNYGRYAEAQTVYRKVIELARVGSNEHATAVGALAELTQVVDGDEAAISYWQGRQPEAAQDPQVVIDLAECYVAAGRFDEAYQALETALANAPAGLDGWMLESFRDELAQIAWRIGRFDDVLVYTTAERMYDEALEYRIDAMLANGDRAGAASALQAQLMEMQRFQRTGGTYLDLRLARLAIRAGLAPAIVEIYAPRVAITQASDERIYVLLALGEAYAAQGQRKKALRTFLRAHDNCYLHYQAQTVQHWFDALGSPALLSEMEVELINALAGGYEDAVGGPTVLRVTSDKVDDLLGLALIKAQQARVADELARASGSTAPGGDPEADLAAWRIYHALWERYSEADAGYKTLANEEDKWFRDLPTRDNLSVAVLACEAATFATRASLRMERAGAGRLALQLVLEALAVVETTFERHPHDIRLSVLRRELADRALALGAAAGERARLEQASRNATARIEIARADPRDELGAYRAAFFFMLREREDLAMAAWELVLAVPHSDLVCDGNALEYGGRMLFFQWRKTGDDKQRDRARQLLKQSDDDLFIHGWYYDEDLQERWCYRSYMAEATAVARAAEGDRNGAVKAWRQAVSFNPRRVSAALGLARELHAAGAEADEISRVLARWIADHEQRLEAVPTDRATRERLAEMRALVE